MKSIFYYVGLHLKLQFAKDDSDKKSKIFTSVFVFITCVVMLFVFKYFLEMLTSQFGEKNEFKDFSTLILTICVLVLTVTCISFELKNLMKPFDLKIIARFPMSSFQTFIAELILVYVNLTILSLCLIIPLLTVFGWAGDILCFSYFVKIFFTALLTPIIPFGLGTIFSVPAMYITTLLENRSLIKLCLFIAILVCALIVYDRILNILAEYFIYQRIDGDTKETMARFITALNVKYNPCVLLKNVAFPKNVALSVVMLFLVGGALLSLGIVGAKPVYNHVRLVSLEGGKKPFGLKSRYTPHGAFVSIVKKELKDIVRTGTYAYYYLGVSITTPVMVFFCNRLVNKVGTAQIGASVAYGVSVLVLLAFMAMINSFSAQAISREKETFYITKITPLSPALQLLAKGVLNLVVALGALIISVFIIFRLDFLSFGESFVTFTISLLSAIGMIFNGFNLNLSNPNLSTSTSGEISQTNMNLLLLIGVFFAIIQGGLAIVLAYFLPVKIVCLVNLALSLLYAGLNAIVFFLTANKKYGRIEFR